MICRLIGLIFFFSSELTAQEVVYPHPVNYIDLKIESQDVKMAYMDVKPA
jgi:hypothetical protein